MALIKKKFTIKGVDCEECERIVEQQVYAIKGVSNIEINREKDIAEIEIEEGVSLERVFERIRSKDYICEELRNKDNDLKVGGEENMSNHEQDVVALKRQKIKIKNMVCTSCEKIISKEVYKLPGIKNIVVNYTAGVAEVTYDENKVSLQDIKQKINDKGYNVIEKNGESDEQNYSWLSWAIAGIGILLLGYFGLQLYSNIPMPQISQNMGYGLLFLVGLLTGFHCVAMCGGFVVSYTTKGAQQGKKPHILHASYALGKTISYTVIGAIFGLLGSIIAFTPTMRGVAGIIAGIFLILFGIKMLGFSGLQKFQLKMPKFVNKWIGHESKIHAQSPFVIGLLNGLMIACGPLQAIYIMAAGTGSMIEGAKLLFVFGLGTLPVMLGFGYITSIISAKATMKILKLSGIVILILGFVMLNRGLALTGSGFDFESISQGFNSNGGNQVGTNNPNGPGSVEGIVIKDGYQEIRMTVDENGFTPNKFVLKKGVPVKWIIDGKQLNGCNNAIQVPKYGLNFDVKEGLQTIEFTPTEEGTVPWSCWMGMLRGTFIVQTNPDAASATKAIEQTNVPKGASCGAGGGGCGCGGARR